MIRQPIISVLGHVDHGKCVAPETEIVLADGIIKPIGEIYESLSKTLPARKAEGGELIDLSDSKFELLSLDEYGRISSKKASHIWKLKTKSMVEVSTNHGSIIKVTPEHPFFSMTENGDVIKVRADKLNDGDFILVPSKIPSPNISLRTFKEMLLLKLAESPDFIAFVEPQLAKELEAIAKRQTGCQGLMTRSLYDCVKHNRFRVADLVTLAKGKIPLHAVYDSIWNIKFSTTKQRACHNGSLVRLPKTQDQFRDAFYVLGALWGDGTVKTATLSNTDKDLIDEYARAIKNAFGLGISITKQRTTNSIANSGWKTFSEFVCQVFGYPKKRKSHSITISPLIQSSPNEFLAAFISGYFDTDGYVSKSTGVEIVSVSHDMIKKLAVLLQRFGCPSVLTISSRGARLKISGVEYLQNFKDNIGFRLQRKDHQLEAMLSKAQTNRNFDITPISGHAVKDLRLAFGLSGMETRVPYQKMYEGPKSVSRAFLRLFVCGVQKAVMGKYYKDAITERIKTLKGLETPASYTTLYQKLSIPHRRLTNHLTFLVTEGALSKNKGGLYKITSFGKSLIPELDVALRNPRIVFNHTGKFSGIVSSDFVCTRVKNVERINKSQFVYDFTQPETHNFIANRCIVHNTSFLDRVRESSVAAREAGGITQHIGATEVPIAAVQKICGQMFESMKAKITIPGLLFIDTPGHEAFTNLRKRGGSIADLAVLVVDVREGFMPQTIEAIEILKSYKTPFIIVANKIDFLSGWRNAGTYCFKKSFAQQQDFVQKELETKLYELVARLGEMGIQSERYDRVDDFTKQVCIVPVSAKTGEGVAEALITLAGLSQKYLEKNLEIEVKGPGKGSILEVKEEKGFGASLDVILYDGTIKRGDTIILSGIQGPIESKVKALLKPKPMDEMRDPKDRFDNVTSVFAASGLKVIGPGVENALPGGQIFVAGGIHKIKEEIMKEMESVRFDHQNVGVIIRSDSLGSLEAILSMLEKMAVPVRKADIGAVSKADIMEAESIKKSTPEYGVVLAFNAAVPEDVEQYAKSVRVKIISNKVIYKIIEDYGEWVKEAKREQEMAIFDTIPFPAELKFLEGCTFRRSGPAIVGMAVLRGRVRPNYPLMKDGERVGIIKSLQEKNEAVAEAKKGDEVAVAIDGPQVGRQIDEGDTLYTIITFDQYEQILKKGKKFLSDEEFELLKEIMKMSRG